MMTHAASWRHRGALCAALLALLVTPGCANDSSTPQASENESPQPLMPSPTPTPTPEPALAGYAAVCPLVFDHPYAYEYEYLDGMFEFIDFAETVAENAAPGARRMVRSLIKVTSRMTSYGAAEQIGPMMNHLDAWDRAFEECERKSGW
ncbi:MAG: hypothetical protein Q8Q44_04595 [Nocardioides sp.]|nr:hypothetical protein [Nocardioides sp.]